MQLATHPGSQSPLCFPRKIRPQYLEGCTPKQMDALYPKARQIFQNLPGRNYLLKIQPYLGQ